MTQAKLAEHLMLTEATISRHITTLVAKELLTKTKDSSNKKSYKLSLTPLGQKEYKAAKKIITKELDSYFSLIKEADTQIIIKNLSRITALITQPKN